MNLQQIRWPVVLLVLALSLGALFGAGSILKMTTVDRPLKEALSQAAPVDSYTVQRTGGRHQITVRLKQSADLKAAYGALDTAVGQVLESEPYAISVEDRRTPELEQVAKRLDLYVQEALVTGQFATMADRVEAEARKAGAVAEVGVDGQRVYVALRKGDAYLYSVVERPRPAALKEGGFGL